MRRYIAYEKNNLNRNNMRKCFLIAMMLGISTLAISAQKTSKSLEPVQPTPTTKQVEWQKMETYAFIHFGLNTFNDKEWGYGNSDVKTFNPKKLDCEQWARTLAAAGMKGVIITAKHHDGFCLWPTHTTDYCIRNTPYKMVKVMSWENFPKLAKIWIEVRHIPLTLGQKSGQLRLTILPETLPAPTQGTAKQLW